MKSGKGVANDKGYIIYYDMSINLKSAYFISLMAMLRCRARLFFSPDFEGIFNRRHHGLLIEEVRNIVFRLYRNNMISVTLFDSDVPLSDLESPMDILDEYSVGLTDRGAAAWEAYSKPDWSKFITIWYEETEDPDYQRAVIECSGRDVLESGLNQASEDPRVRPVEDIETLQPFQATYWKLLPIGFRGCFVVQTKETYLPSTALSSAYDEWSLSIRMVESWDS